MVSGGFAIGFSKWPASLARLLGIDDWPLPTFLEWIRGLAHGGILHCRSAQQEVFNFQRQNKGIGSKGVVLLAKKSTCSAFGATLRGAPVTELQRGACPRFGMPPPKITTKP